MEKLTEEYVKSLFLEHGIYWCDESEYIGLKYPVVALNSYGYKVMVRVSDLRRNYGVRPFYKSNPYTIDNIKIWCEKNTDGIRLVDEQEYTDAKTKLKFECSKCGSTYEATWDDTFSGVRCLYCAGKLVNETNSFYKIHPDLLIYFKDKESSKTISKRSSKKIILICPNCGAEKISSPNNLVRRGFSCKDCNPDYGLTRDNKGMFNETIINRNKDEYKKEVTTLYVVRCFDDNESFYKIGVTSKGLKRRFSNKKYMSYKYESLHEEHIDLYSAAIIEIKLHGIYSKFAYTPFNKFSGWTECFSEISLDEIKTIINDYKNKE